MKPLFFYPKAVTDPGRDPSYYLSVGALSSGLALSLIFDLAGS